MVRLRVAIVAPSLTILGGQSVQADRLLRAWRDDPDVEAWLVPVDPTPSGLLRFAVKVKYARTIATELTYVPRLARELARADVVHVFSASYWSFLLAPAPALLVARLFAKPVILNYRSGEAPDHLRRSMLARWLVAKADRNIVPSRFLVDVFRRFGIAAEAIPNIVDFDRFPYRSRLVFRPRILSTRNFETLYNVACTIRAFRIIQDRWPDATLTLVGGGREERALRALAASLGLRHVIFAGRVMPDDIGRYYSENDIYVQTPNIDNMPTSVIEAYATGLPVVSTDAGGVPVIVTSGETGLLARLDDHRAIAAHVITLVENPGLAARIARNAYRRGQSYAWSAVRARWLDTYRGVLGPEIAATEAARPSGA